MFCSFSVDAAVFVNHASWPVLLAAQDLILFLAGPAVALLSLLPADHKIAVI
jgi:hypothetical protein